MILEFKNVTGNTKYFNLQDISFALEPGYIMGLAGKNGAGKSTLIDYIMNPKQQYKGEILIEGKNIRNKHYQMMNRIDFISDNNKGFLFEKSAKENIALFGPLYDEWEDARFYQAMQKMNLSPGKIVGKMSRGELFKFQTAFAIAHRPALYLIDEATAGMDPVFRIDYFKILQEIIAEENASILMTSHIQDEIQRKMDYVGIMEAGKLKMRTLIIFLAKVMGVGLVLQIIISLIAYKSISWLNFFYIITFVFVFPVVAELVFDLLIKKVREYLEIK